MKWAPAASCLYLLTSAAIALRFLLRRTRLRGFTYNFVLLVFDYKIQICNLRLYFCDLKYPGRAIHVETESGQSRSSETVVQESCVRRGIIQVCCLLYHMELAYAVFI
jgi:hypothetical protein